MDPDLRRPVMGRFDVLLATSSLKQSDHRLYVDFPDCEEVLLFQNLSCFVFEPPFP